MALLARSITFFCLFGLLAVSFSTPVAVADEAPFAWGALRPGEWPVGVEVETIVDRSRVERVGDTTGPRRLRLVVWSPTHHQAGGRLTLGTPWTGLDLARLLAKPGPFSNPVPDAWVVDGLRRLLGPVPEDPATLAAQHETLRAWLAAPAYERFRAPPASSASPLDGSADRPLVLWGMRHETAVAQAPLSAFLASHGYVVASVEPLGVRPTPPWEADAEEVDRTLRNWTRDVQAALAVLRATSGVAGGGSSDTALIAWSYGGMSALLTMLEADPLTRDGIGAFVSLDATAFWSVERLAATAYGDASSLRQPALIFSAVRERDATIADAWGGPLEHWTVRAARHGNFNAAEGFWASAAGVGEGPRWSAPDPGGALYAAIAERVLHFLDETLRGAARDTERIESLKARLDADVVLRDGSASEAESDQRSALGRAERLLEDLRYDDAVRVLEEALASPTVSDEERAEIERTLAQTRRRLGSGG